MSVPRTFEHPKEDGAKGPPPLTGSQRGLVHPPSHNLRGGRAAMHAFGSRRGPADSTNRHSVTTVPQQTDRAWNPLESISALRGGLMSSQRSMGLYSSMNNGHTGSQAGSGMSASDDKATQQGARARQHKSFDILGGSKRLGSSEDDKENERPRVCVGEVDHSGESTSDIPLPQACPQHAGAENREDTNASNIGNAEVDDWMPPNADDDVYTPVGDIKMAEQEASPVLASGKSDSLPIIPVAKPGEHEKQPKSNGISKLKSNTPAGNADDNHYPQIWESTKQSYSKPDNIREKRSTAMQEKFELATKRVTLEDTAKTNGRFARPLLKVIEYFEEKDTNRPEVAEDKDLSNPSAFTLAFAGEKSLHSMWLKQWLSIEPQDSQDAWFDENTLANMVLLKATNANSKAYFCDPADVYVWLSTDFKPAQQIERMKLAIHGLEYSKTMPEINGARYHIPAEDMPADATCMVMPFNTGLHWVAVKFEPDLETQARRGTIRVYDSLEPPQVSAKVRQVMPIHKNREHTINAS